MILGIGTSIYIFIKLDIIIYEGKNWKKLYVSTKDLEFIYRILSMRRIGVLASLYYIFEGCGCFGYVFFIVNIYICFYYFFIVLRGDKYYWYFLYYFDIWSKRYNDLCRVLLIFVEIYLSVFFINKNIEGDSYFWIFGKFRI